MPDSRVRNRQKKKPPAKRNPLKPRPTSRLSLDGFGRCESDRRLKFASAPSPRRRRTTVLARPRVRRRRAEAGRPPAHGGPNSCGAAQDAAVGRPRPAADARGHVRPRSPTVGACAAWRREPAEAGRERRVRRRCRRFARGGAEEGRRQACRKRRGADPKAATVPAGGAACLPRPGIPRQGGAGAGPRLLRRQEEHVVVGEVGGGGQAIRGRFPACDSAVDVVAASACRLPGRVFVGSGVREPTPLQTPWQAALPLLSPAPRRSGSGDDRCRRERPWRRASVMKVE
ncbi:MAG: hypothetical protein BJ554DRAFT_5103 [Olpidium bornovanus]|uniref:Uncharacterized protein n=1 Tax=Olpidium bornovanus TaxID=278681 RepID=A0A8H7ZLU1_9FUNG|nr:MAG: hypothetical protein BJ554DRAFT_5103 [Olpidium bornovanus]